MNEEKRLLDETKQHIYTKGYMLVSELIDFLKSLPEEGQNWVVHHNSLDIEQIAVYPGIECVTLYSNDVFENDEDDEEDEDY